MWMILRGDHGARNNWIGFLNIGYGPFSGKMARLCLRFYDPFSRKMVVFLIWAIIWDNGEAWF